MIRFSVKFGPEEKQIFFDELLTHSHNQTAGYFTLVLRL
jgi:hypothetical protein